MIMKLRPEAASPDADLLASPRFLYYSPAIAGEKGDCYKDSDLELATEDEPYNLISSLCEDGLHRPALDIDLHELSHEQSLCLNLGNGRPVWVRSTNNWHVYFPESAYEWLEYEQFLSDLVRLGVIEEGYAAVSVDRGQTVLRPPHIKKGA